MTAVEARPAYDVRLARTVDELEELRPAWEELQSDRVTSDPDYYLTLLGSEPRIVRPHVLLLERDGSPEGLVVGRIEEREIVSRIGYRRVYAPRVRSLTVSYGGFLGPAASESPAVVVDELRGALRRREADVVYAPHVRLDSAVYATATGDSSILTRQRAPNPEPHWYLKLPGSFDDFLASKGSRSRGRIRRYRKKLLDEHGDSLAVKVITSPDEIDSVFEDAGRVAALTYQHGLGVAFSDVPLQRNLVGLAMERGWFRGYVLYLEGEPRAFWFGNAYRGTFHTGPTGYDPAYGEYNVGTFLLMRMIEDMCADSAIGEIDYGFGDAEYKHTFGTDHWLENDLLIFSSSARAVRINLLRSAVLGVDGLARKAARRSGGAGRLKRGWRRRLASGDSGR